MFQHILVPLDGSRRAEQALPVAAQVARASKGTITLLQVVNDAYNAPLYGLEGSYPPPDIVAQDLVGAQKYLERVRLRDDLAGVVIEIRAVLGHPATVILDDAWEQPTDLIILSSHGYTGIKRWLLGSIAERVARHSPVPVLILRGEDTWQLRQHAGEMRAMRALAPVDTSTYACAALTPAANLLAALSAPNQGQLHLTQIVVTSENAPPAISNRLLQNAKRNLATVSQDIRDRLPAHVGSALRPELSVSASLASDVAEGIVKMTEHGQENGASEEASSYDFIVLTTHSSGGLQRWSMGSIVEHVLHATHLPLLIVRPAENLHKEECRRAALAHSASR
jgi:nucleotide-binding universal stress UspA family protein